MKQVTLAAFNSREEAEPICQYLKAAGIRAELRSESPLEGLMAFARPSAGVQIEVARDDFEGALKLIYDWNASGGGESEVSRPMWMGTDGLSAGASAGLSRPADGKAL